jgi:hypothetical protein
MRDAGGHAHAQQISWTRRLSPPDHARNKSNVCIAFVLFFLISNIIS